MSGPVARLQQIASALKDSVLGGSSSCSTADFRNEHAQKHQPGLPKGLRVNNTPLNPVSFLLRAATLRPDRVALKHPAKDVQWTYAEWTKRICALAYGLKKRGIKRGDRVCIICPNVPMILDLIQALPAIHAVMTPMNIRLTKPEVDYILQHSGSTMIIVDSEFKRLAEGFKGQVIVSNDSCGRDPNDPYEQLIADGQHDAETLGWRGLSLIDDEEAPISLCYTSGTTGRPKGVISTYRGSYLAGLANAFEAQMNHNSVYLWILPAFHAVGWTYPWAITASIAGQVCLRSVGDYSPIWEAFKRDKITTYCAAPTVQIAICNHPSAQPLEHDIRTMIAGAAPSATLIQNLESINIRVCHVYGLTETYGPFTACVQHKEWDDLSKDEFFKLKAQQGFAYSTSDIVRVVRTDSSAADGFEDVRPDGKEVGEIIIRGNLVMKEYYNDTAATAKAFDGGYFHTGDLAVMTPTGAISIQDRSKDIIISGGENASSLAIESALFEHPDVLEVAVVARPHPQYGERAHAFVLLRDSAKGKWASKGDEFEIELKNFSKTRLPGFARPEWVELVDILPKTSTGKIQKHELRKKFGNFIPT